MPDPQKIKVKMDKGQLVSEFEEIFHILREYRDFLMAPDKPEGWELEAVQVLRHHQLHLFRARASLGTIDLVCALLREVLASLPTSRIPLKVLPPPGNGGSAHPETTAGGLPAEASPENLVAWINGMGRTAPLDIQVKLRRVLGGILEFFEQLQHEAPRGIEGAMNRINLLTTNQQTRSMVREIALITRDVFEALKMVSEDLPLDSLADSHGGISEAVRRLHQVVARLDEATEQSLEILEKIDEVGHEANQKLSEVISELQLAQKRMMRLKEKHPELADQLTVLQSRLSDEVGAEVMAVHHQVETNKRIYVDLISNQSFHELSANTLKKVIAFVESLEKELLDMLRAFRPKGEHPAPQPREAQPSGEAPAAPQSQEDVDQLLGELGF